MITELGPDPFTMPARYAPVPWSNLKGYSIPYVPAPDWSKALCKGMDQEMFFGVEHDWDGMTQSEMNYLIQFTRKQYAETRKVCQECPLMDACGEYAVAHEREGMWGGLTPGQRAHKRKERKWAIVEFHYIHRVLNDEALAQWQHDTEEEAHAQSA